MSYFLSKLYIMILQRAQTGSVSAKWNGEQAIIVPFHSIRYNRTQWFINSCTKHQWIIYDFINYLSWHVMLDLINMAKFTINTLMKLIYSGSV